MSWTERRRVRRFFARRVVPAAEALRGRGVRFFARRPEPEAASFWVDVPEGEPEFTLLADPEACERALRDLWEEQGLPELAELAHPLIELARHLEVREEEAGEVSPFVYVMY
jgi:hypothetical protein